MPNVLITGARRDGIGGACARTLGRLGWNVGLGYWDVDEQAIGELVDEVSALGVDVRAAEADLGDAAAPARLFDELEPPLGGPFTALVACHCRDVDRPLMATSADELDRHFAINARSVALLIQQFATRLHGQEGRVVAFTSDALEGNVAYGVSKGALDRVVKAAAIELGPQGIRANTINPGPTETGWISDQLRADLAAQTPLGRTSLPSDSANLVAFLVSPEGGWVTGQLLHSNGGLQ